MFMFYLLIWDWYCQSVCFLVAPHKMGKSGVFPLRWRQFWAGEAAPDPPPPQTLPPFSAFPQSQPGRAGRRSQCNLPPPSTSPRDPTPPSRFRDSNCGAHYKSVSQCELPTPNGTSSIFRRNSLTSPASVSFMINKYC